MARNAIRSPSGNLPVAVTSFVGRQREIARVREFLRASRLVTLTGPGGVGKTRLAIEATAAAAAAFAGGVWLVDLESVSDPDQVAQAAATALGVGDHSGRSARERLTGYLAGRPVLILLDNCEHLAGACAELAGYLLRNCPGRGRTPCARDRIGPARDLIRPYASGRHGGCW